MQGYFFIGTLIKHICAIPEHGSVFPHIYERRKNLTLNLTGDDCNKILEKFKSAIMKIKNHEFEPNKSKENCRYCAFKDFCNLEISDLCLDLQYYNEILY